MRKNFVVLCVFCLFLCLSCSKKSEKESDEVSKVVESNKIDDTYDAESNDVDYESDGFEGFVFDESEESETDKVAKEEKKTIAQKEPADDQEGLLAQEAEEHEPEPAPEPEKPKDLVPPAAVTKLSGYYNGAKNAIPISWTEPEDSDFSHVVIYSNGKKEGTAKKGTTTYDVKAETIGNYDISVVSYDYSGNKGPALDCSVEAKFFNSASLPLTGVAGKGMPVRAVVKGVNFAAKGITPEDYVVSCKEDSSVVKKAVVKIVNDNTLHVDVSIPRKAGNYNVVVKCGNNEVTGNLKVISVDPVGTVIKADDGTPVAILAGYNGHGLPFGVALNEQKGLKWATSFGYYEKFEGVMCVVPPEQLGTNSAVTANITGDLDGWDNWDYIVSEDSDAKKLSFAKDNYPVFHYALTYGNSMPAGFKDGWFIPSLYELCQIYENMAQINEVMVTLGVGTPIGGDFYWSSSQCDEEDDKACAVRFNSGSIFKYKRKSDSVYGRCVRMVY